MKAIVDGATGFVGRNLVNELLKQGNEVAVIVRNPEKIQEKWLGKVRIIEASLEDLNEIQPFQNEKYDIFFHFAWSGTSGIERADINLQLMNVKYTCDAVSLAKRLGCKRFVNAGSIMEYEVMQFVPADGTLPGMGTIYSTAKLTADFMAKTEAAKENIDYINVIISNIYGVGEKSARFFNTTLLKMINNEKILLTEGNQLYDFIYITDAVRAIIIAALKGCKENSYYIGHTNQQPLKEFIWQMHQIVDSKSELLFGAIPYNGAFLTYREWNIDSMNELGFSPEISFEEGVRMTKAWMIGVDNGYRI